MNDASPQRSAVSGRSITPPPSTGKPLDAGRPATAWTAAVLTVGLLLAGLPLAGGCGDEQRLSQEIRRDRQRQLQVETRQDNLGEAYRLLERLVELNADKASQQIRYSLNQWRQSRGDRAAEVRPASRQADQEVLIKTLTGVADVDALTAQIRSADFVSGDVRHLREAYLFRQIVGWVDMPGREDPLLADWWAILAARHGDEVVAKLQTASRLFDWAVRNVALEPLQSDEPAPPGPELPLGMVFQGPGYRQTDFETVWRGTGDAWQRTGVIDQLFRQAGLTSAIIGTQDAASGQITPRFVGVLVAGEIYLFEPGLGLHVPGPDQVGIATLAETRKDASILRRLNVPGFFDYPVSRPDVQQCVALLNLRPEAISDRMAALESDLISQRLMTLHVDAASIAQQFDAVAGIAGVRLWDVPLLAEVYHDQLAEAAQRDPLLSFWLQSRWAILESEIESSREFSLGRWNHLCGRFDDDADTQSRGARTLYLQQRAPEFEIADLRIDVDLQKAYGIRRDLGIAPEMYDRQVQAVQGMMRMGKRTATYWISLIHYDDARFDSAQNWLSKRVLDDNQPSPWADSARYVLARAEESLGNVDAAIELYKTEGVTQEHGNRIRARLLGKNDDGQ